jgi:hypothetical protein
VFLSCPDFKSMAEEGNEEASFNDYGFPRGCFILRSVSSGRLLDVASDSVQDGASMILWPEKDSSLVEGKSSIGSSRPFHESDERAGFRRPEAVNQVSTGGVCWPPSCPHNSRIPAERSSSSTTMARSVHAHQGTHSTSKVSYPSRRIGL